MRLFNILIGQKKVIPLGFVNIFIFREKNE